MENIKYTWDLTKFCKDIKDCESKMHEVELETEQLAKYKGQLNSPTALLEFWEKYHKTINKFYVCHIYANANLDTHYDSEEFKILSGKIEKLNSEIEHKLAFVNPELNSLDNAYFENLKQDSRFTEWKLYIDSIILNKKHTLSETEEKMLAEISKFTNGYKVINQNCYFADIKYKDAIDSKGQIHKLNSGNISSFSSNPDRVLRKNVSENSNEAYQNYGNLMTQNFIYYLTTVSTLSKIRKYNSVLESYLEPYKIDKKVYDNVINFTIENLDIQADYYSIKKKLLNLDEMYNYDLNAPIEKTTRKYTFEEGVEIVKKALSILGQDYVNLIDRAIQERWLDVYPRENKRSGGYCWGTYSYTYIVLLNWTGELNDVFTLAHELGHAIQHYFTEKHQKIQNSDFPIFIAETASTFNEIILGNYLLNNCKNNDEKLSILNTMAFEMISTVFTQVNFSRFEDFCYKSIESGEPLSKEILQNKWIECTQKHLEKVVTYPNKSPLGWQNIWHFYNASYYVWQYALAYMISSYFANNVLENTKNALENYFNFLKSTSEYYPAEFLKTLGVDINSKEFYKTNFKNFRNLIEKFKTFANNYKK